MAHPRVSACAALLAVVLSTIPCAQAVPMDWVGGTGSWFDGVQWFPAGPPGAGDDARIINGGGAQIAASGAVARNLTLGGSNYGEEGSIHMTAGSLAIGQDLVVGDRGRGEFTLDGGSLGVGGDLWISRQFSDSWFWLNGGTLDVAGSIRGNGWEGHSHLSVGLGSSPVTLSLHGSSGLSGIEFFHVFPNARVEVLAGATMQVSDFTMIDGGYVLIDNGTVAVTPSRDLSAAIMTLDKDTEVRLNSAAAALIQAEWVNNYGRISGPGRIEALPYGLTNGGAAELEVGPGETMTITGSVENWAKIIVNGGTMIMQTLPGGLDNVWDGQVSLAGGMLHVTGYLSNGLDYDPEDPPPMLATIVGYGTLRADGGLANASTMTFNGLTNILGNVNNMPSGLISVSGPDRMAFFNDLRNDGEVYADTGATALYYGTVSGVGTFTGLGTHNFLGTVSPGSSPGTLTVEGDAVLGPLARLLIEIAGTTPGEFDIFRVGGSLTLDGTLEVQFINGFIPPVGSTFGVLDFDPVQLIGTFDSVLLPPGYEVDFSEFYHSGQFLVLASPAAIPEPATLALLGIGAAALLRRRRRRA